MIQKMLYLCRCFIKPELTNRSKIIKYYLINMDKQVLKQVLLDNAQLVKKIEVLPCWEWLLS